MMTHTRNFTVTVIALLALTLMPSALATGTADPYAGWEEVGTGSATGKGISNNICYSGSPSVAVAPDGTPYVAWDDGCGDSEIYVRRWNGIIWEEVGTGSARWGGISNNSGQSEEPSLAIAPDGTPYVAWEDDTSGDYEIYVRRWNGSTWEEVGSGSATSGGVSDNGTYSSLPSLAIGLDGAPYIAWYNSSSGNVEIYVKRWNGSVWEEIGAGSASGGGISNSGDAAFEPSIAVDPDGTPYVAWTSWGLEDFGSGLEWGIHIYVRRWNGNTWEEVGPGSATGGGISNSQSCAWSSPAIAVAPTGIPYVAWLDSGPSLDPSYEIYVRRWTGGVWEEVGVGSAAGEGISDTGQSTSPTIVVAPDNTPCTIWADGSSGEWEIYARQWNGNTWEEVGYGSASGGGISDSGSRSETPSVAAAPDGTLYAAWAGWPSGGGVREVYIRRRARLIREVEINQVLGRQVSDPPKYVAGKSTVVQVFLSQPVEIDAGQQSLVVRRDSELVTTLYPSKMGKTSPPTDVLTFRCTSMAACEHWQAGSYIFEVTVNGRTAQTTAVFQERASIRLLVVPVKVKLDGSTRSVSDSKWKDIDLFVRHTFPVPDDGIEWIIGSEVNGRNINLTSEWTDKVHLLCKLFVPEEDCSISDVSLSLLTDKLKKRLETMNETTDKDYDFIVGVIPAMPLNCRENVCKPGYCGCILGWSSGRVVVAMAPGSFTTSCSGLPSSTRSVDNTHMVVTHELGHAYDLWDEYDSPVGQYVCDINPPPPHYKGRERGDPVPDTCEGTFSCGDSTEEPWLCSSGQDCGAGVNIDSSLWHPFELYPTWCAPGRLRRDRGAFEEDLANFMGGGNIPHDYAWVSSRAYNHLFDQLGVSAPDQSVATSGKGVLASGLILGGDGVLLDPWFEIDTTPTAPISGTYTIEAVDGISQTLAIQGFETTSLLTSNSITTHSLSSFATTVPFPMGTAAFHIRRDDDVLFVVPVSANVPTVTVTAPTLGESMSGVYTTTWESSDLDGDDLYHIVRYSPDGQDWLVLTTGITETQLAVDFDALGGGDQARIGILVSDGVNTAEGVSEPFSVTFKSPDVSILTPISGTIYEPESNVVLFGRAYDLHDSVLQTDDALSWQSDRDGFLGRGELLNLDNLSEGVHTITLSATNSLSMTTVASATIEIGYHNTYLPLVLHNDSSPDESTTRMTSGWVFSAVLTGMVVYGAVLVNRRQVVRVHHRSSSVVSRTRSSRLPFRLL